MPPSSSSRDCDAVEVDCAPRRGVKLNMATARDERRLTEANYQARRIARAVAVGAARTLTGWGGRDAREQVKTATLALALVLQPQAARRRVSGRPVRVCSAARWVQTRQPCVGACRG